MALAHIPFARATYPLFTIIQFITNYDDLSTDKGFQFDFHCDQCRNGYMSHFQPNAVGIAGRLLQAASSLFGGLGVSKTPLITSTGQWSKTHDLTL